MYCLQNTLFELFCVLLPAHESQDGRIAFFGKNTGVGGGFDSSNAYLPNASSTRYVPNANAQIYNPNAEVSTASRFGEAVLMLDINNNSTLDLIVGEPFSDSPSGQTQQGKDSGRLYIIRGGY